MFVLKHKSKKENKDGDALSRRASMSVAMKNETIGFEEFNDLYEHDRDFG
jgi:hypothetical protein